MNNHILQLQEMVSHLEHGFSKLSEELYTQQKELAALRNHVLFLQKQLCKTIENNSVVQPNEDPPPHY